MAKEENTEIEMANDGGKTTTYSKVVQIIVCFFSSWVHLVFIES